MTAHATLSASGAPGWMRCYGKLAMEKPFPNTSSAYADEGTAAHEVAQMCLEQGQDASAFAGRIITVARGEGAQRTERKFTVDEEMVEHVQRYVDIVRGLGGELMVEQRVDFSRWIGVDDSFGTSDAVVIWPDQREVAIVDLKYGRGVAVSAEENEQAQLYACGTLDLLALAYDVEDDWTVRLMIVQPRIGNVSEWTLTVAQLKDFAARASVAARHAMHQYEGKAEPKLTPGEKQCRFCRAKAACPALRDEVKDIVSGAAIPEDFADLAPLQTEELRVLRGDDSYLSAAMQKVDLVEQWCKAVRAETERRLLAGQEVPGFKLVQGKRGARAWVNPEQAEEALKAMRLKTEQMYDMKLISPTTAEKLHKAGAIGPRQWAKVQELYDQSEGSAHVAPAHDKRPALSLTATADDFAVVDEGSDLA